MQYNKKTIERINVLMNTFSSQFQAIMNFKRCSRGYNPKPHQKEFFQKIIDIFVKDINNDTIKAYENFGLYSEFDSKTPKVLISDTTLRCLYHHKFVK